MTDSNGSTNYFDEVNLRRHLRWILSDGRGQIHFRFISPERGEKAKLFSTGDVEVAVEKIREMNVNDRRNVYYHVNVPSEQLDYPTYSDEHFDSGTVFYTDVDIDKDRIASGEPIEDLRSELRDQMERFKSERSLTYGLESTFVWSGNGYQMLVRTEAPVPIEKYLELELRYVHATGGDLPVHNVGRILRVGGTTNWPNSSKIARGYSPCAARFEHAGPRYKSLEQPLDTYLPHLSSEQLEAARPHSRRDLADIPPFPSDGIPEIHPEVAESLASLEGHPDRSAQLMRVVNALWWTMRPDQIIHWLLQQPEWQDVAQDHWDNWERYLWEKGVLAVTEREDVRPSRPRSEDVFAGVVETVDPVSEELEAPDNDDNLPFEQMHTYQQLLEYDRAYPPSFRQLMHRWYLVRNEGKFYDRIKKGRPVSESMVRIAMLHAARNVDGGYMHHVRERGGFASVDRVAWYPKDETIVSVEGETAINTFRGLDTEGGDEAKGRELYDLWVKLTNFVLGEKSGKVLRDHIAWKLQNTDKKPAWHILIVGEVRRTGKSMMFRPLHEALGNQVAVIDNSTLNSQYDDSFSEKLAILVEELKAFSNTFGAIKHKLVNGGWQLLNPKGRGMVKDFNAWAFYAISNHWDCLRMDPNEDKFYVCEATKVHMGGSQSSPENEAFRKRYEELLKDKSAVRGWLKLVTLQDVSKFDAYVLPERTKELYRLCSASALMWETTLEDMLQAKNGVFAPEVPCFKEKELKESLVMEDPSLAKVRINSSRVEEILSVYGFEKHMAKCNKTRDQSTPNGKYYVPRDVYRKVEEEEGEFGERRFKRFCIKQRAENRKVTHAFASSPTPAPTGDA